MPGGKDPCVINVYSKSGTLLWTVEDDSSVYCSSLLASSVCVNNWVTAVSFSSWWTAISSDYIFFSDDTYTVYDVSPDPDVYNLKKLVINWTDYNIPTYECKAAASWWTDKSLVTTGEKYNWNNKADVSCIPTNNCQLTNWCWYTTCTGTLVASDLTPYALSDDVIKKTSSSWSQTVCTTASGCTTAFGLKSNATSSSYMSFSTKCWWVWSIWVNCTKQPVFYNGSSYTLAYTSAIPTDNCQLANSCWYTTCTWTLNWWDLKTVNGCCLVWSWDICIQWGWCSEWWCITGTLCNQIDLQW